MQMKTLLGASVLLFWCASPALAGDVTVTMKDGRVTVNAENAPVRQILQEWARVGQTKIVGAERLAGAPLTLQLVEVPERQALETLLRAASGYMAAPRAVPVQNASMYDRILILPTSIAPPATASAPGGRPTPASVAAQRPTPAAEPTEEATEDMEVADDRDPEAENAGDETNVDYANPELMLQRRQREMMRNQAPTPTTMPQPGQIVPAPNTRGNAPAVFPGTAMPPVPGAQASPVTSRPGEIVLPPQTTPNPYGLPPGVQPGSQVGPPVQPDRAKYMNPYQPQKPPDKP
jgi:hypothetical protein